MKQVSLRDEKLSSKLTILWYNKIELGRRNTQLSSERMVEQLRTSTSMLWNVLLHNLILENVNIGKCYCKCDFDFSPEMYFMRHIHTGGQKAITDTHF